MAKIAYYEGGLADVRAIPVDVEWAELAELLTNHESHCSIDDCKGRHCPAKNCSGWSPVDIEGTRRDANVKAVTFFVADLDHCTLTPEQILAAVDGYACILHSTHSHSIEDACYRLIVPLSRPATYDEWPRVRRAIVDALKLPTDPTCKDRSRFYFLPTVRKGVDPVALSREGASLEVDEALQIAALEAAREAPTKAVSTLEKPVLADGPINLADLNELLATVRRSKANGDDAKKEQAEILARVLEARPLASSGARDTTILRAVGMIARHLPVDTPWAAVLEIIRPSLSAMDCKPEGLDHWIEQARQKYERAAEGRRRQDAKEAAENAATLEIVRAAAKRATITPEVIAEARAEVGQEPDPNAWIELLIVEKGKVIGNEHNAITLFSCAPELKNTLRWDDFSKRIIITGGPLVGVDEGDLDTTAAAWLQRNYEYRGKADLTGRAMLTVARRNRFDSLKEYLLELAWDGENRLDTFLERYLGCEASPYVKLVSRQWLISLVARALEPGCQVDTVLVLEGEQGKGKSSALRTLVGRERFVDTALALGEKETMQTIAQTWLVELGELASFNRAEVPKTRQFITSRVDKFRPPYGRVIEEYPRRCVLVGTTNDDEYLVDRKGNRRYLPVRTGKIDLVALQRDRELLLAEAIDAYQKGERWHLNEEEQTLANAETEDRMIESTIGEQIDRWWFEAKPEKRPSTFTLIDVAEAIEMPLDRLTHAQRCEIGYVLKRMGFSSARSAAKGRVRVYCAPPILKNAEQRASDVKARHLALVRNQSPTPTP